MQINTEINGNPMNERLARILTTIANQPPQIWILHTNTRHIFIYPDTIINLKDNILKIQNGFIREIINIDEEPVCTVEQAELLKERLKEDCNL